MQDPVSGPGAMKSPIQIIPWLFTKNKNKYLKKKLIIQNNFFEKYTIKIKQIKKKILSYPSVECFQLHRTGGSRGTLSQGPRTNTDSLL